MKIYDIATTEVARYTSQASAPVIIVACKLAELGKDTSQPPAAYAAFTNDGAQHTAYCTACGESAGDRAADDGAPEYYRYVRQSGGAHAILTDQDVASAWASEHAADCSYTPAP